MFEVSRYKEFSVRVAEQSAKQRQAVNGKAPEVDVVATAGSCYNETEVPYLGLKLQRPMPDSEHLKPPVDIPASIAPWRLMKTSRGKINLPSGLMQLLGNLATRRPTTYDQHCSGSQLAGVAIVSGVNLKQLDRHRGGKRRDLRQVKRPGGNDDIDRFERWSLLGFDQQPTGCRILAQRNDPEAAE